MIILRKEWFGGIIADCKSYDIRVLNDRAFELLKSSISSGGVFRDEQIEALRKLGFECSSKLVRIVDRSPVTQHPILSAPVILWLELTSKCPLKCKHCFINCSNLPDGIELPYEHVSRILTEAAEIGVVRVTLSGGEAFCYPYIRQTMARVNELGMGLRIFTNGIINRENMVWLKEVEIDTVFFSLDGGESHHDELRGNNTFAKARKTLIQLSQYGNINNITLSISLDKRNIRDFDEILNLCNIAGVKTLLLRPLMGYLWTKDANAFVFQDKAELLEALKFIEAIADVHNIECQLNKIPKFPITKLTYVEDNKNNVSLWNVIGAKHSIDCVGGNLVCGIRYDGIISPCGFIGLKHDQDSENSIYDNSLADLWLNSPNLNRMRNIAVNQECGACKSLSVCNGGCRANSFNLTGDLSGVDPYCLYNDTSYGRATISQHQLISSAETCLSTDQVYISEKRLVSKCGWATYE